MPSLLGGLVARDACVHVSEELGHRTDGLVDGGELLERAERGQLRDEFSIRLRTGGILILQLHHEQLQKRVAAERIGPRRGIRRTGLALAGAATALCCVNTHGLAPCSALRLANCSVASWSISFISTRRSASTCRRHARSRNRSMTLTWRIAI